MIKVLRLVGEEPHGIKMGVHDSGQDGDLNADNLLWLPQPDGLRMSKSWASRVVKRALCSRMVTRPGIFVRNFGIHKKQFEKRVLLL